MTPRRAPWAGALLRRLLLAAAVTLGAVVAGAGGATAADLANFRPGNIISDQVFFAGDWMGEAAVQQFLDEKGSGCRIGADGAACLKDYRTTTQDRAPDDRCRGGYAGRADERASAIIAKVAHGCGINAQVLLVTLQKEQGLVTTTGAAATDARYRKAMGFGCPDTAACDARYYGFFNQVYQAAWQFKNYQLNPTRYAHRAGMTNNVRFHPNAACGSSPVHIENQATAGLYNYTPYQPNGAALAAGYGTGDACSSYGNRNFWNYFTDWFGPTHGYSVSPQMTQEWNRLGGPRGDLGVPVEPQRCGLRPDGCSQRFSNGTMYWSPSTGARAAGGLIHARWASSGGLSGSGIGYPTTSVLSCPASGCLQRFQSGAVAWSSATGAHLVGGLLYQRWAASGLLDSGIGYPTSTVLGCDGGVGCAQAFQRGTIAWSSATGAHLVGGILHSAWQARGGPASSLGYPTSTTLACSPTLGCPQSFRNGLLVWAQSTGTRAVPEPLASAWTAAGGIHEGIGLPTESLEECPATGCLQRFARGAMAWSGSGDAHLIGGIIYSRWVASGGLDSGIGYPVSTVQACDAGTGCVQRFQRGAVAWSGATGAQLVGGLIWERWRVSGVEKAGIGMPTSTVLGCGTQGCEQTFQRGSVAWSPATGAHLVGGMIHSRWRALGGTSSPLGFPTSTVLACTAPGCTQTFTGGAVAWTPAAGAHAVWGPVRDAWEAAGGESRLGRPVTTAPTCTTSCVQEFERGAVDWTQARGAQLLVGPIFERWRSSGGTDSGLGQALDSSGTCDQAAGCVQRFQYGAIASSVHGAHLVGGQIHRLWSSLGAERSALGYPRTTVLACDGAAGCTQEFDGGAIRWTAATGAQVVAGRP
ncbi:LGFP repeat protein [Cellulomonas flavigena DSM 20109]|uniref:LGFP repeat protein n=1 Tax=Cellulomonas flavigena (strain ATCC 482 / DSM 20109 / BCRC 11376 / JCM 18109 / NBRC 3775 / NCIMB 8073 / NRS 134) TaxID=446466 RepID=D5UHE9_CELFN|nr:LGFP repeat protein [Cellulomonas flavigena]ADG75270.1 LGFP repeat protein [Cellulomonas flavigena DSM 20109]